jgi:nitrate/TMAO reductase-like tetraheme cytochrome c subunit
LIFVPVGIALAFVGIQTSSQPAFCGTCHIMKPYYASWQTSSHKDVACVECHIPPGIGSELRKKYEALSMLAKYFTATYGTNPWAEVPDQSCLRPGCHEQRLLAGRTVFQRVLFDHRPHLTEMRREKRLRCTSCHSQIVQGEHIAVTESTCFLCHFKNVKLNEDTARCTLCHEVPETIITTAGLAFDHADVKRFGMECTLCHGTVIEGNGDVAQQRCYTCHGEPERLERFEETEFLHRMHVTDHKVDCLNCHTEIQHRIPKELQTAATGCQACHMSGHAPQRDLYVGIGGKGVAPQSAAMYLAAVSCESCHLVTQEGKKIASEVSCMSCHGAKFNLIYQNWQRTLKSRLEKIQQQLAQVRPLVRSTVLLRRAEDNLTFVERARSMHNPGYATALLTKVHEDLKEALKEAGISKQLELPWPQAPYHNKCLACHLGAETIETPISEGLFRHEPHVVRRGIECTSCHQDVNYREPQHGTRRIECAVCHSSKEVLANARPAECLQCHRAQIPNRSELVGFPHEIHVDYGFDCYLCHEGVNHMSHLDFLKSEKAVPKLEHGFCVICHVRELPPVAPDRDTCTKCHLKKP